MMTLAIAQGRIPSLVEQARERFNAIEALATRLERADLSCSPVNNRAYAEYQGGELRPGPGLGRPAHPRCSRESGDEPYLPYLDTIASIQVAVGQIDEAIETLRAGARRADRSSTPRSPTPGPSAC